MGTPKMIRLMKKFIDIWADHGFIAVLSLVIPVYWEQDIDLKNNGYDIPSLWGTERSYARTTWWKRK